MARNRPDRSREDKAAEIVAIARRRFLELGYVGTTIAAVAREAGIASNVVHWYFATKDDLFVAVLEAVQSEDLQEAETRLARSSPGQEEEVLETLLGELALRRLDRFGLIATLHERSHSSPVVAEFHERAHRRYADHLGRALDRCSVAPADRKLVVEALITAVEGLVMHRATRCEAESMMSFLARRLITDSQARPTNQEITKP